MVYNANFSSPENDANNNHHGSIHVILRYHENVASISVHHVNGCVIVSQKLQCQREEMPVKYFNTSQEKKKINTDKMVRISIKEFITS